MISEPQDQTRRDQFTVKDKWYIQKILQCFQMDQCKPLRTAGHLNWKLLTAHIGDGEVHQKNYRRLVGLLLYPAIELRADIMLTVNIPSRHINAPTSQHWLCRKLLLSYLQVSKIQNFLTKRKQLMIFWGEVI